MTTWKLKVGGKTYTMQPNSEYEYRAHMYGMYTLDPNNWVACHGFDEDGTGITAWYFVEDISNTALDDIDYDEPNDIIDEHGHMVYDKQDYENR